MMLPEVKGTLKELVVETGLRDLAEKGIKELWKRAATVDNINHHEMVRSVGKREGQEEWGRRPEAWVHIKKVTRQKNQSR